ncbi:Protein-lysine N-methyltransferase EFM5 [Tolypocladium paradoxum]|uniref:Protein-lysine N-methyltransferase EFM5 n=1 Tax=Tolypocladium paradoxum TaxID=94208 RepID=A0A2S4KUV9_9HYPO|nr:Protein-lysine N-methyltransferase EFM5 [Tolypocladium paradoxum]
MADSCDEPIALSAHALAALAEFKAEKDVHQAKFAELQAEAEANAPLSMEAFTEDWNESQFWYSDETAGILANQLLDGSASSTAIGVVSTPSVFVALRNILSLRSLTLQRTRQQSERPHLVLLEHDERFAVFPEFVHYDFQQPLKLPAWIESSATLHF